jgi:hypothetical protein
MQACDEGVLEPQNSLGLSDLRVVEVYLLAQFQHLAPKTPLPQHERRTDRQVPCASLAPSLVCPALRQGLKLTQALSHLRPPCCLPTVSSLNRTRPRHRHAIGSELAPARCGSSPSWFFQSLLDPEPHAIAQLRLRDDHGCSTRLLVNEKGACEGVLCFDCLSRKGGLFAPIIA